MGYSVYYKPPKEEVDKLKNDCDVELVYSIDKCEIIKICMEPIENVFSFSRNINLYLKSIYKNAQAEAENLAYHQFQEDGEIWFTGWDKAQDSVWDNIDDLCRVNYDSLFIIALVKTPDYFENEENYYKKYNDICETINTFREECFDFAQHELMEKFKEYKDKNEE